MMHLALDYWYLEIGVIIRWTLCQKQFNTHLLENRVSLNYSRKPISI